MSSEAPEKQYDLFVVGGGVNGCGIARDAAGRGIKVGLAEAHDLGSGTSSASTKLFHGGLRYLEFFEFRLVREALEEREILLRAMPHISWPMRFVLPFHKDMRFEADTPVSKLLQRVMPWMRGRRPAWLIRLGLFLYDQMGGRKILPATKTLDLKRDAAGASLRPEFKKAFEYSDCWIEDSRLVVLNARDAAMRGAHIHVRTKVVRAEHSDDGWRIHLQNETRAWAVKSKVLVNAAGPWVGEVIRDVVQFNSAEDVRLVRGSHIVTKRLFDHDKCYFFQGVDGRIIFAIPYEQDFTLIGTTDEDHPDPDAKPVCTPEEADYLLQFASQYFKEKLTREDIVWTYSGVRPLYDDGATSATAATRDYVLSLSGEKTAPLLSIFGGKITTYRKLAEAAIDKLSPILNVSAETWTRDAPLPGGDFPVDGVRALKASLCQKYSFLSEEWASRLVRHYGTEAFEILGNAGRIDDLGQDFGATVTAAELDWAYDQEWVRSAEDFLWRRTKIGLVMKADAQVAVDKYLAAKATSRSDTAQKSAIHAAS
ncbi:MAG: glycerol-3-phosphate dehydrogenase [Pseudomonadota bacterium]